MVADKRVREAMSIAINRAEIAKGILLGNADPAFTFVDPDALDYDPKSTKGMVKEDIERAKKLLDEAGWKPGADGIREKDGVKLQPKVYYTANANSAARRRGDPGLPAHASACIGSSSPGTRPSRRSRWPSRTTRSGRSPCPTSRPAT